jgi:short-subunit dehydrogenase
MYESNIKTNIVNIVNKINIRDNILIVGGSKGIGLALATEAATKYSNVTVIARNNTEKIKQLNIDFINQNFNDIDLIRTTIKNIKPNIVILCVAQGLYGDIFHLENDKILNCINTTYLSTIFWIKELINMLPSQSRVGWISSLTAQVTNHNWSVYASAKAGVEHFISSIREKAEQKKISITVCYPGCVATGFHEKAGTKTPENAINPDKISKELLIAIESGLMFWAAPVDREVINETYQIIQLHQNKFRGLLQ